MTVTLTSDDDVAAIGSSLVGWPVLSATPVRRGGNNRIFLLAGHSARAALKFYPPQAEDPRDRLGQEFGALSFLHRHGIAEVPRPLARDAAHRCAAFGWIDGAPPGQPDAADVDQLADFFIRLQGLRERHGGNMLVAASAACLSPAMATDQVGARLARLCEAIEPASAVADFVGSSLAPAAQTQAAHLEASCAAASLPFAGPLPRRLQALSPSDFGLHNAVRRPNGRLAFLDFEYFGWDDPAKAIADVMLHPGMALSDDLAGRYRNRVVAALGPADSGLSFRLDLLFPSMVLLWCLIMLNEFLPERWTRRAIAGHTDDRDAAQVRQLQKARDLFSRKLA